MNKAKAITRFSVFRLCLAASIASLLLSAQLSLAPANAAIEAVQFDKPEQLKRYQALIAELRCLVCQNQNLADSDANLAKDLRRKTEELLKAGQTDQQIREYMRERYGDFVLYRPPLNNTTSFLWLGPFILLIIAIAGVFLSIARRQKRSSEQLDEPDAAIQHVRDLLNSSEQKTDQ